MVQEQNSNCTSVKLYFCSAQCLLYTHSTHTVIPQHPTLIGLLYASMDPPPTLIQGSTTHQLAQTEV